jgi:hypothetical protein
MLQRVAVRLTEPSAKKVVPEPALDLAERAVIRHYAEAWLKRDAK